MLFLVVPLALDIIKSQDDIIYKVCSYDSIIIGNMKC